MFRTNIWTDHYMLSHGVVLEPRQEPSLMQIWSGNGLICLYISLWNDVKHTQCCGCGSSTLSLFFLISSTTNAHFNPDTPIGLRKAPKYVVVVLTPSSFSHLWKIACPRGYPNINKSVTVALFVFFAVWELQNATNPMHVVKMPHNNSRLIFQYLGQIVFHFSESKF